MQNKSCILNTTLSVLLLAALTGCNAVGTGYVGDVRLTSVSTVNLLDHPEVDWLGGERPALKLLKISFETRSNLEAIAKKNEFNTSNSIFFCMDGPVKYQGGLGQFSGVYTARGAVSPYRDEKEMQSATSRGTFEYQIYIDLARESRRTPFDQVLPAYDLRHPSGDLCVRIHGGNMLGGSFDSNIATIPVEAISGAGN
jgi:hypothetical protein